MLDGEQAAWAQPPSTEPHDGGDHRHAVRSPEHGAGRIMFSHFGFELSGVWNVGRVGHQQVDLPVKLGQQARVGDVGAQ